MKRQLISLIIPIYNEELGIQETIKNIPTETLFKDSYALELVVIDNNSTDNSANVARELGATVIRERQQGYGFAYKKGYTVAKGEILISCDGDNSYPVEKLPELLRTFQERKLDFLTTNRFSAGYFGLASMPFINRLGNQLLSYLIRVLYKIHLRDSQSGMWIIKKETLNCLRLRATQMNFSQEIKIDTIYYQGGKWQEVDIPYRERTGERKLKIMKDGFGNLLSIFYKWLYR